MSLSVSNEQVDYVFKQLKITGWPHAAAVTLTALAAWFHQPDLTIVFWFCVLQASHVMRIWILDPLWIKSKQTQQSYRKVRLFLSMGMFSTGCWWALIPLLYLNDPHSEIFVFVSIALAGMICATLPALAAYLPAYLSFITPIFAALAIRYVQLDMGMSAFLTMSFLAAMAGISYVINGIITRSITIDFKNQVLLGEITDAKDKAEQANQAKSRFLAAASHDLRQPLQALGLLLESIRHRLDTREQPVRPLVHHAIDAQEALSALLNALLELSRLESHDLLVQETSVPIKDLVRSILCEFEQTACSKGLHLHVDGHDALVLTDPVLFSRVLRNLVSNAIKFTHQGAIQVKIEQHAEDVSLSIIDTGIGIPLAEQGRIFDEYYQVSNEARNRQEGIGLGLSVVKRMCELLHHPIEVHSAPGQGTQFTVRLPRSWQARTILEDPAPQASLEGRRILVVDDDASLLSAVGLLMRDWKCEVVTAETLESALEKTQVLQFQPEIILSDYRLGAGITGMDAITRIRSAFDKPIPALLLTADTDPALVKAIRELKYFLIHKPVKPVQLRKAMATLLEGDRLIQ